MSIDWDQHREMSGYINLSDAFKTWLCNSGRDLTISQMNIAIHYIEVVESLQRINSRQAAAMILTNAHYFSTARVTHQ